MAEPRIAAAPQVVLPRIVVGDRRVSGILRKETVGGGLLLLAATVALVWGQLAVVGVLSRR